MGLFKRIGVVIRGFFSLFVSRVEEMSPEALIQDVRYQIDKAKRDAERQIIDLQTSAEIIKIENVELGKKASDINVKMIRAKENKDSEMLAMLICEKEDCEDAIKENKDIYDSAMKEVDVLKNEYKYFVQDMDDKVAELKKLKSQAKMTDIRTNINTLRLEFSNRSKSTENMRNSLDRVKEIINQRTAKSNAIFSFNQDNLVNNSFVREERTVRLEKAKSIAQNMLKDAEVKVKKIEAVQPVEKKAEAVQVEENKAEAVQVVESKVEAVQAVESKAEAVQAAENKAEAVQVVENKAEAVQVVENKAEAVQAVENKVEEAQAVESKAEAAQVQEN